MGILSNLDFGIDYNCRINYHSSYCSDNYGGERMSSQSLGLTLMFLGVFMIGVSLFVVSQSPETTAPKSITFISTHETACYDKHNNKINGVTCEEIYLEDGGKIITFVLIGTGFIMLGLISYGLTNVGLIFKKLVCKKCGMVQPKVRK